MEILPGIGLNIVSFGSTKGKVLQLLGNPSKQYVTPEGCERWQYYDELIELSFEPDNDDKLGWIEVHNPSANLKGKCLFGSLEDEAIPFLETIFSEESEREDYGHFVSVNFDLHWVEVQFSFGKMDSVHFGVLYNEDDIPMWPNS